MHGIITEPGEILDELAASRQNGNAIGIWAPSLGNGVFMCGVDKILDDDVEHDKVIILKERDVRGRPLEAHVLFLQEIEKVYPSSSVFDAPAG